MPIPVIVWTDHKRRLVMIQGDTPEQNQYHLEVIEGDRDAMGKLHWRPTDINWELFRAILGSVLVWKPVELTPDEMQ